jgi:hypothetical protein
MVAVSRPMRLARCRGVLPSLFRLSVDPPAHARRCSTATRPLHAAACTAVQPRGSTVLAPTCSSATVASRSPAAQARWRAAQPSTSASSHSVGDDSALRSCGPGGGRGARTSLTCLGLAVRSTGSSSLRLSAAAAGSGPAPHRTATTESLRDMRRCGGIGEPSIVLCGVDVPMGTRDGAVGRSHSGRKLRGHESTVAVATARTPAGGCGVGQHPAAGFPRCDHAASARARFRDAAENVCLRSTRAKRNASCSNFPTSFKRYLQATMPSTSIVAGVAAAVTLAVSG